MTPAHQLVHVASSSSSIAGGNSMVLDIAGRLPAKGQFVPLVIQATSSLREETQTWRFSDVREPAVGLPMCVCVCVCGGGFIPKTNQLPWSLSADLGCVITQKHSLPKSA